MYITNVSIYTSTYNDTRHDIDRRVTFGDFESLRLYDLFFDAPCYILVVLFLL